MKKLLSCKKTALILLLVTVLFLGFYTYMVARPISYGMSYHNKIVYEGEPFEGTVKFYPDGTVVSKNTNFEEELTYYYYLKNGYIFNLVATTPEEYEEEVAYINENFEQALAEPFYAAKTNAFKQVAVGMDEEVAAYTCTGAIVFAAVGGAFDLALIALTVSAFVLSKKAKQEA